MLRATNEVVLTVLFLTPLNHMSSMCALMLAYYVLCYVSIKFIVDSTTNSAMFLR
jgi:hypothetical protein